MYTINFRPWSEDLCNWLPVFSQYTIEIHMGSDLRHECNVLLPQNILQPNIYCKCIWSYYYQVYTITFSIRFIITIDAWVLDCWRTLAHVQSTSPVNPLIYLTLFTSSNTLSLKVIWFLHSMRYNLLWIHFISSMESPLKMIETFKTLYSRIL